MKTAITTVTLRYDPVSKRISALTPYNPAFVQAAKTLGGKWDSTTSCWTFPNEHEGQLRALCLSIYGTYDGAVAVTRESLEKRLAVALATVSEVQELLDELEAKGE